MKRLIVILLALICMLDYLTHAQTPYDSFAPETSRPMLGLEDLRAIEASMPSKTQADTMLCAVVIDMQAQRLLLVDVVCGDVIALAPLTDDMSKWLSVDPMSDKYPGISPYAYCGWNSIMVIDPNGEEEWSLDVNTGQFQKIGDKGGITIDYYYVGTYDGETFFTYSNYELERGDATINSFRIQETDKSTISAFHIPETDIQGFLLERPGPDTDVPKQALRIPANQYRLHENLGSRYPGVPRLYLPSEGIDGAFDQRGILIHAGNFPENTEGCLLPGISTATDYVGGSKATLQKIINYVVTAGWSCKLNIINAFR